MNADLDLRGVHQTHEADPAFVARLEQRLDHVLAGERGAPIELVPSVAEPPARRRVALKVVLGAAAAAVLIVALAAIVRSNDALDPANVPLSTEGPVPPTTITTTPTDDGPVRATSGAMWPQSSVEEVRAAQERADAGDPDYTWQLDTTWAAGDLEPWRAEIFTRFIDNELGWEDFASDGLGYAEGAGDVTFVRCAPGRTDHRDRLDAEAPPEARPCAPTIDERTYETVRLSVSQPERRGPSGIWVVDQWEILEESRAVQERAETLPYSILDGEVTFAAAPPWTRSHPGLAVGAMDIISQTGREHVAIAADPLPADTPGCDRGPAVADAEALAQRIMAVPSFDVTATAPVRIAGLSGLQLDVAVTDSDPCYWMWWPEVGIGVPSRLRLYIVDHPGESAQVLTIGIVAWEERFAYVFDAAIPILESIEIHAG